MFKAFFFDMDGVLVDSMPHHAIAWQDTLALYGIPFAPRECYLNEGRTGRAIIRELAEQANLSLTDAEVEDIYRLKTARYREQGGAVPMHGTASLLHFLQQQRIDGDAPQLWVVTGGGQPDLFEQLEAFFPGVFRRDRMITAHDVQIGKPDPEPYLKAWERSGLPKADCCVVENAPLGVTAGHAAGLCTLAVNTGILTPDDLASRGADHVFPSIEALHAWLQA